MSRQPPPAALPHDVLSSPLVPTGLPQYLDSDDENDVPPPPPESYSGRMSVDEGAPPPPPPEVDFLTGETCSPPSPSLPPRPASLSASPPPLPAAALAASPQSAAASPSPNPRAAARSSVTRIVRNPAVGSPAQLGSLTMRSARPSAAEALDDDMSSPASRAQSVSGASASMLTSATDLGSGKSFASSLTHNFGGVSAQVEVGLYAAKRVSSFIKKLALAQEEYSRTISKILAHEQTKLPKLSQDQMGLVSSSWLQVQELYTRLAKSHMAESADLVLQVVAPLQEFVLTHEQRRKEILLEERKVSVEMTKARLDVEKGLVACTRLLDEAKKLQADAKEEGRSGEKASFFKTLTLKVGRKPDAVIKEAAKSAAAYQASILTANKRQARYVDQELPTIFNDLQALEQKRLDSTKQRLLKFHATSAAHATERAHILEEVRKEIERQAPAHDLGEFIENQLYQHGPPSAPRPFSYELPCSPSDIEDGRLEGHPNSIFRSSIDHCMELQRASSDQVSARLDVPRIVPALIARIRELHGVTELGIFRISVGKEDLDGLRKQIDVDQNYQLSNITNPHVCAALLKEWLRLLLQPLIPTDALYAAAIDSVRGSGDSYNPSAVQAVFDKLPLTNQKILRHIGELVKEISEPANSDKSKMSVDNCAIVFAPSFLRNPSEDPVKLMESTKFETKFTAALFKLVADIRT